MKQFTLLFICLATNLNIFTSFRYRLPFQISNLENRAIHSTTRRNHQLKALHEVNELIENCDKQFSSAKKLGMIGDNICRQVHLTLPDFTVALMGHVVTIIGLILLNNYINRLRKFEMKQGDRSYEDIAESYRRENLFEDPFNSNDQKNSSIVANKTIKSRQKKGNQRMEPSPVYDDENVTDNSLSIQSKNDSIQEMESTSICPQCRGKKLFIGQLCDLCDGLGTILDVPPTLFMTRDQKSYSKFLLDQPSSVSIQPNVTNE